MIIIPRTDVEIFTGVIFVLNSAHRFTIRKPAGGFVQFSQEITIAKNSGIHHLCIMRIYYACLLPESFNYTLVWCFFFFFSYINTFYPSGIVVDGAEGRETCDAEWGKVAEENKKTIHEYFRGPVIGFSFADAWEHSHLCTDNDDENHLTNCVFPEV